MYQAILPAAVAYRPTFKCVSLIMVIIVSNIFPNIFQVGIIQL